MRKEVVYFLAPFAYGTAVTLPPMEITGYRLLPFEAARFALRYERDVEILAAAHGFLIRRDQDSGGRK